MNNSLITIGKKSKRAFFQRVNTQMKNQVLKDYHQLIKKNKNV